MNRGVFRAPNHPKVLSGEINEEQVFDNFIKYFNDKDGGLIDKREWDDYYSAVSFSMDSDDHFYQLLRSEWRLN